MQLDKRIAAALVACAVAYGADACVARDNGYDSARGDAFARQAHLTAASLQTRSDAEALLVRALLTAFEPGERGSGAAALAAGALRANDADALVLYLVLSDIKLELPQALRASAIRRLQQLDGDNLAVALLAMPEEDDAFDDWLRSAVSTTRFDAYLEQTVLLLVDAAMAAPQADGLAEAAAFHLDDHTVDAQAAHAVAAFGVAIAHALPNLQPLSQQCDPHRATAWSAQREHGCLRLAKVLSTTGRTLLDRQFGLSLQLRLVEQVPERADAVRSAKRRLQWQQMVWIELSEEQGEAARLSGMLANYRRGLGELDTMQALLQQAGMPMEPPADWTVVAPVEN